MKKFTLGILFASAISLFGCGGGVEGSGGPVPQESTTVDGSAQKGPFVIGSSIVVSYLNDNGSTTTSNIQTETINSIGNFSFTPDETGPVRIQAEGYHLNEITGELSAGELTLRAVYNITSEHDQAAFVNILTHLIHNRVLTLMAEGNNVNAAISQAQDELLQELSPVLEKPTDLLFTSLSVYNVDGSDIENNDYLLALSAIVYQTAMTTSADSSSSADAELTSLLNNLSSDLANNGKIDQTEYIEILNQAKVLLDKEEIESNLIDTAIAATGSALDVPDIGGFLVGMIVTSPADEATITSETTIRALFPKSLSLSEGSLLIDGVSVIDNIDDLSAFNWNPYYWGDNNRHSLMVTAENEAAGQVISNLISVTVNDSVKQLLIQTTPTNGSMLDQVNQTQLSWQALSGASNYEVQVSTNQNFLSDVTTYTDAETSITATNLNTTTYYWRVKARNIFQWGPWTNSQSFSVIAPELPTLNEVEITQNESVYDLSFSWQDMGDGNTYRVYLKDLSSESKPVIERTTTENSLIILDLDLGNYEWQLQRTNSLGQESDRSTPNEINIGVFHKRFGGSGDDRAKYVLTTNSGQYLILASTTSGGDALGDDWIFKLDEQGEIIWEYLYKASGTPKISALVELSNGSIIGFGRSGSSWHNSTGWIVMLDDNGTKIWEKEHTNPKFDRLTVNGVTELDGSIYIVSQGMVCITEENNNVTCEYHPPFIEKISMNNGAVISSVQLADLNNALWDNVSSFSTTSTGDFLLSFSVENTDCAYLPVCSGAGMAIINTFGQIESEWISLGVSSFLNGGYAAESPTGGFALSGQSNMGTGVPLALFDSNAVYIGTYTFSDAYTDKGYITFNDSGKVYQLVEKSSVDWPTLISINSDGSSQEMITFSNLKRDSAHPAALSSANDGGLILLFTENQSEYSNPDVVVVKVGSFE